MKQKKPVDIKKFNSNILKSTSKSERIAYYLFGKNPLSKEECIEFSIFDENKLLSLYTINEIREMVVSLGNGGFIKELKTRSAKEAEEVILNAQARVRKIVSLASLIYNSKISGIPQNEIAKKYYMTSNEVDYYIEIYLFLSGEIEKFPTLKEKTSRVKTTDIFNNFDFFVVDLLFGKNILNINLAKASTIFKKDKILELLNKNDYEFIKYCQVNTNESTANKFKISVPQVIIKKNEIREILRLQVQTILICKDLQTAGYTPLQIFHLMGLKSEEEARSFIEKYDYLCGKTSEKTKKQENEIFVKPKNKYTTPTSTILPFEENSMLSANANNLSADAKISKKETQKIKEESVSIQIDENQPNNKQSDESKESAPQNLNNSKTVISTPADLSKSQSINSKNETPEGILNLLTGLTKLGAVASKLKMSGKSTSEIAETLNLSNLEFLENYSEMYEYLKDVLKLGEDFFHKMNGLISLIDSVGAKNKSQGIELAEDKIKINTIKNPTGIVENSGEPTEKTFTQTEKEVKEEQFSSQIESSKAVEMNVISEPSRSETIQSSKGNTPSQTELSPKTEEQTVLEETKSTTIQDAKEQNNENTQKQLPENFSFQLDSTKTQTIEDVLDFYKMRGVDVSLNRLVFGRKRLNPKFKDLINHLTPENLFEYTSVKNLTLLIESKIEDLSTVAERYGMSEDSLKKRNFTTVDQLLNLIESVIDIHQMKENGKTIDEIVSLRGLINDEYANYYLNVYSHLFEGAEIPLFQDKRTKSYAYETLTKEDFRLAQQAINKPKDVEVSPECVKAINKVYEAHLGLVKRVMSKINPTLPERDKEKLQDAILDGYSYAIETYDYENYAFSTHAINMMNYKFLRTLRNITHSKDALWMSNTVWLDQEISPRDGKSDSKTSTFATFVSDGSFEEMTEDMEKQEQIEYARRLIRYLSPESAKLLLEKTRGISFEQIASLHNQSRQSIHKRYQRATNMLKDIVNTANVVGKDLTKTGESCRDFFERIGIELGFKSVQEVKYAYANFKYLNKQGAFPGSYSEFCKTINESTDVNNSAPSQNSVKRIKRTRTNDLYGENELSLPILERGIKRTKNSGYLVPDDLKSKVIMLNMLRVVDLFIDGEIDRDIKISDLYASFMILASRRDDGAIKKHKIISAVLSGKNVEDALCEIYTRINKQDAEQVADRLQSLYDLPKIIDRCKILCETSKTSTQIDIKQSDMMLVEGFYSKFIANAPKTILPYTTKENRIIYLTDLLYGKSKNVDFEFLDKISNCSIDGLMAVLKEELPENYYGTLDSILHRTPEYFNITDAKNKHSFYTKKFYASTQARELLQKILNAQNDKSSKYSKYYAILFENEAEKE